MKTIRLAIAAGSISATLSANAVLIYNGDFELPDLAGTGSYYGVGSTAVTGWTVVGSGGVNIHHVNQLDLLWPNNSSQFLDLTGSSDRSGGGGVSSVPFVTVVGQTYLVTFDAVNGSRWFNTGKQNDPYFGDVFTLQASGAAPHTYTSTDLPPGSSAVPPAGNLIPVTLSYLFVADGIETTLTFMDVTFKDSNAGWIDNVSVSAVPEPTTMIAGGLLLFPFAASTLRFVRRSRMA